MRQRYTSVYVLSLTVAFAAPLAAAPAETPPAHGEKIDEILVTAHPYGASALDSLHANSVLAGEALERRLEPTIGETLSGLPGISSTYFGPAASRPVIRGLGGDRVRILSAGIGSLDASSTSPDHAVALDTLSAERIEVIRGPGTLLYGSSAVGGVVNVFDGKIPTALPAHGVSGAVRGAYGTAADERAVQGAATLGLGPVAVHVEGDYRKTGDVKIPGFAESAALRALEGDEDSAFGILPNSASETKNAAVGASYVWDGNFLGLSYTRTEMNYGVPGHAHDGGDDVSVDLKQNRFDLMGEIAAPVLVFEKAKLRFGYGDYRHQELDGGVVDTTFNNKGYEGRVELVQRQMGALRGAVGVQVLRRDFSVIGAEAFVPPTLTKSWGIFAVEELALGLVTLEAGARFERQVVEAETIAASRSFNAVSVSGGASVDLGSDYRAGVTLSRSERAPNAEELFSNGPHVATNAFEVGDTNLHKETALAVEGVVRKTAGRFTAALSVFYTKFNNFIYEAATGDEEDGLPVFAFRQAGAKFYGGELELGFTALDRPGLKLDFDAAADLVRASRQPSSEPLPRIPPQSLTLGTTLEGNWYDFRFETQLVASQKRVSAFELPTDGYALINAALNVHPFPDHDLTLSIRGRNLANSEARQHTSFLKDLAPLPGRDVRFAVQYRF